MKSLLLFKKNLLFLIITISLVPNICLSKSKNNTSILSPDQQFQLDFIHQEIHEYPELFTHDWTLNSSVELIVETAELAVQKSSARTKKIMQQRIIDLFDQINIKIYFNDENLIFKVNQDAPEHTPEFHFDFKNNRDRKQLKKHRLAQKNDTAMKLPELQKIKGARRTLRRVKQKMAEQKQAEIEQELARVRYDEFLRRKQQQYEDRQRNEPVPEEHENSLHIARPE